MVEIKLEDKWILFGSGEMAHYEDSRERLDDNRPVVDFLITPNDFLKERYSLKDGEEISREHGLVLRTYQKDKVNFLPICGGTQFVIIETNFRGEETDYSRKDMEKDETIIYLRKRVEYLHGANMELLEENSTLTNRYMKFFKDKTDLVKSVQIGKPREEAESPSMPEG
jgi:hypothetical protein